MPRIAVFGGTGYLASLIKHQNNIKNNKYVFFSRKKNSKNYVNFFLLKKKLHNFKGFDFIIHLSGPNQDQLKQDKSLIKEKKQITSNICDLCLANNIKLIYVSSMQVYNNYGSNNLHKNSKINHKNNYSKSHFESEKIILSKFLKNKKMFTILRLGNVFGFKKYKKRDIENNLVHSLCEMALKKKKILVNQGSIQRTFVPSQIFIKVINLIIKKKFFNSSIINIFYKNYNLKDLAELIQERSKLALNLRVDIIIKNFSQNKNFLIFTNKNFRFNPIKKIIINEIDQILKIMKKNI